jgi:hypothetical protein
MNYRIGLAFVLGLAAVGCDERVPNDEVRPRPVEPIAAPPTVDERQPVRGVDPADAEHPSETTRQKLKDAAGRARDKINDAGDRLGDGVKDLGHRIDDAAAKAKHDLKDDGSK